MEKQKISITKILGYLLYAGLIGFFCFKFINGFLKQRINYYFKDNVETLYLNKDKPLTEYLNGYITTNQGFIDTNPLYTLERNIKDDKGVDYNKNTLQYKLNIYRCGFPYKGKIDNALAFHFEDLKYNDVSLLYRNRKSINEFFPNSILSFKIKFDRNIKQDKNTVSNFIQIYIDPAHPYIISEGMLKDENGEIKITGIEIQHLENANQKEDGTFLLSINDHVGGDNVIKISDINLSFDKKNKIDSLVKGEKPTETELKNNPKLYYKERDLKPYNGRVIGLSIGVIIFAIVSTYFLFFHKHLKNKILTRRDIKHMEEKENNNIDKENVNIDKENINIEDATFTPVSNKSGEDTIEENINNRKNLENPEENNNITDSNINKNENLTEMDYNKDNNIQKENKEMEEKRTVKIYTKEELMQFNKRTLTDMARNMKLTDYTSLNKKDLANLIFYAQPKE